MKCLRIGLWLAAAALAGIAPARADLSYSFSTDQSSYVVSPNGSVAVQVFLNEFGAPSDPFVLADPTGDGLFSTGVRLNYPAGSAAQVLSVADIAGNPLFDNAGFGIAADADTSIATAGFTQAALLNPSVHGTPISGGYQLYLGTFTFTAGADPGWVDVAVTRFDSGDNVITGLGASLDSLIADGAFSIQVVPEPTSLAMCAIGGVVLWGYARRRTHTV